MFELKGEIAVKELPRRMNLQLFAGDGDNQEVQNPGDNQQPENENQTQEQDKPLTLEEVQRMIQSETDKVRSEYSKKLKDAQAEAQRLATEAERLAKEKMTEEEKAEFERQKLQKELEEKERALLERELNLLAVDLLTEAKMPLEFKEFVVGVDEEATKAKVATLKKLWTDALEKAVQERFKEKGRNPHEPSDANSVKNPWSKEHFNLTEQARLLRENPELAATLRQMAR